MPKEAASKKNPFVFYEGKRPWAGEVVNVEREMGLCIDY